MDLKINDKTVLVSASSGGIGLAIAARLAAEGAIVHVNGRTTARAEEAVAKIRKETPKAKLHALAADLGTLKGFEETAAKLKEIDILVNNLGIYEPKSFGDITDQDWLKIFEINVLSGIRLSRRYLPGMLKRNWGRIIFISSESGISTPVEMIHYGMTKTSQLAVARGLAEMTKDTNVTVNSVLPGPTRSEGVEQFIEDNARAQGKTAKQIEDAFFKTLRPSSLLQRFATPEEVANLVAYVASPLASATNGTALRVDGGVVRSIL